MSAPGIRRYQAPGPGKKYISAQGTKVSERPPGEISMSDGPTEMPPAPANAPAGPMSIRDGSMPIRVAPTCRAHGIHMSVLGDLKNRQLVTNIALQLACRAIT